MDILKFIDEKAAVSQGEILVLTAGEFDSHGVECVVTVLRDANLREWADDYLQGESYWARDYFSTCKFVDFLEKAGVVSRMKVSYLQVAGDFECLISTPVPQLECALDSDEPKPLPYEEFEAIFDPRVPG